MLTALRAAAIVIVATGLNDVIAGAAPRYEPLYAYLGAIALVVLLDGVILGAFAAALAIGFYALLFLPRPTLNALAFPIVAATLTLLVFGTLRMFFRSRQRAQPVEVFAEPLAPPLLPPPPPPFDNTEVLHAIDELRDELRTTVGEISSAREREELLERTFLEAREALVARLRIAEEEARAKDAELQRQLDAERAAFEVARNEALSLAAEEAALAKRVEELEAANASDRARSAAIVTSHERRIADLNHDAEQLRIALEAERTRALRLSAEVASERERVAEAQSERTRDRANVETARSEIEKLQRMLAAERAGSSARAMELEGVTRELTALRETDEREATARAEELRELRSAIEIEKNARENAEREVASIRETLDHDRASLVSAREAHEREANELRSAIEIEKTARETVERELRETRAELESERDEAISRATDLATLRRELELERARAESERALRERSEQDLLDGRRDIALLESRLTELDALRAAAEGELTKERASFDEKLDTIVAHLAQDHEADLGKAVLEREEARAEARSVAAKLGKVQARIEEDRQAILTKLREADERYRTSLADANQVLAETRTAAQKEIERLQLRIAELEQQQHATRPAQPLPPSRGRVLIAHPDPDMRATARASLERAGYEIVSAADGLEALRTAIAQKVDVVIADTVMPKMNGRELCQLLKSQEKTAHIRVILLTRATDDLPKGDLPPDLMLRKPVPLETLKSTLAELVTRA